MRRPDFMSKETPICCVLVHGTFSQGLWTGNPNTAIRKAIKARIPSTHFEAFKWSGCHSQAARSRAADELKSRLSNLSQNYEKIAVIGHSHGGNVGLQAIQALGRPSVALVTLATPFLYALPVNEARNLRAVIAGFPAVSFLAAILAIFMRMEFWELSTVPVFGIAVGLFVGAILTSNRWIPMVTGRIAPYLVAQSKMYQHMTLLRPLKMLIIYYPNQDGITNLFNSIRRCSLRIAKQSRRSWTRAGVEDERWLARSPNRVPALCVGAAGILAVFLMSGCIEQS